MFVGFIGIYRVYSVYRFVLGLGPATGRILGGSEGLSK